MSVPFWIGDSGNQVMRFVDATGTISTPSLTSTDLLFTGNGGFISIQNIAADSLGNVYVVDSNAGGSGPTGGAVYQINSALNVVTLVGASSGSGPLSSFDFSGLIEAVATDSAGNVYIGDNYNGIVYCVNMQATTQTILGVSIAAGDIGQVANWGSAPFLRQPTGLVLDSAGNLYISDEGQGSASDSIIWKVTTAGAHSIFAGQVATNGFSGDGGAPTSALLTTPNGVGIDAAGNIYISDAGNNCIRAINTQGTTQTLFGTSVFAGTIQTIAGIPGSPGFSGNGGPAISAQIGNPSGSPNGAWNVVIGPDGNLYTADTRNFEIRMVNVAGIINAVAGNHTNGYTGDGGPATSAEISIIRGGITFAPPQATGCGGVTTVGNPLI
jgi:hypothetical protein